MWERVGEWVQEAGWVTRRLEVVVGWGGRMSRLVPLFACAFVECKVTWKRPSFSRRLVSCVCLKSTTVPLLTHHLSANFSPNPKKAPWKHTADQIHLCRRLQSDIPLKNTAFTLRFPPVRRVKSCTESCYHEAACLRWLSPQLASFSQQSHARLSNASFKLLVRAVSKNWGWCDRTKNSYLWSALQVIPHVRLK